MTDNDIVRVRDNGGRGSNRISGLRGEGIKYRIRSDDNKCGWMMTRLSKGRSLEWGPYERSKGGFKCRVYDVYNIRDILFYVNLLSLFSQCFIPISRVRWVMTTKRD